MHIPDGLLSAPVWLATDAVSMAAVGYSVHRLNRRLDPAKVPLMAVTAAFVFAAQMINLPVPGLPKVSGHLLGGLLAAMLVGPLEATIVMAAVFVVQAVLFQDGGILALGANVLNMGLVATLIAYGAHRVTVRLTDSVAVRTVSLFVAGWLSVMLGACLTGVELAVSRTVPIPLGPMFAALLGVHALIGVIEGALTTAAIRLVAASRPDLIRAHVSSRAPTP